jgi:hypothetical protein
MWVKGTPLHFIVDNRRPKEPHLNIGHQTVGIVDNTTPDHTTSGGFAKDEIFVSAINAIFIWNPTLQG